MCKREVGVMVMKDGLAWGITYEDGYSTTYGWVKPAEAQLHDPDYCKTPAHVTYSASPDLEEIKTGKLVKVERITTVSLLS